MRSQARPASSAPRRPAPALTVLGLGPSLRHAVIDDIRLSRASGDDAAGAYDPGRGSVADFSMEYGLHDEFHL